MSDPSHATVTVEGDPALLAAYRRARERAARRGIRRAVPRAAHRRPARLPPQGARWCRIRRSSTASAEFPNSWSRCEWQDAGGGTGGRATLAAGALAQQASRRAAGSGLGALRGARRRATARSRSRSRCRRGSAGEWIGYAVTAAQHAFFRVRRGPCSRRPTAWTSNGPSAGSSRRTAATYAELDPREPLDAALAAELDRLATPSPTEWLWFAADHPARPRWSATRYAAYGFTVRDANLRSAKLRGARAPRGRPSRSSCRPRGARGRRARDAPLAAGPNAIR